ncbi:mitochondrial intermembrane space import and assembly protein 40 [Acrodontium crateriforme]|uniref:Mitochondrial intermembrane space import and assembly protein 40 n=1 Tax=Acrodontium crateriforme TaxID=150365 RepID=A0AAQ3LYD8_9PEZI|nr:mitochondrial intermembrane space import and assembly protein 40 [Acrodontium crateriforme]
MFRPTVRSVSASRLSRAIPKPSSASRFITTAPPHKTSRSWKNFAIRLGLAGGVIYWYNTSNAFGLDGGAASMEPSTFKSSSNADYQAELAHPSKEQSRETDSYPTVEALAEQRRAQAKAQEEAAKSVNEVPEAEASNTDPSSPEGLEAEASQQGAFNEETGEINWDCPCLGGMAHGPCGEQFREAFSCFVYSKEEPKGVECIEHFKNMQSCFREHPEIYGSELDEDEVAGEIDAQSAGESTSAAAPIESSESVEQPAPKDIILDDVKDRVVSAKNQVQKEHGVDGSKPDELVPKAANDA